MDTALGAAIVFCMVFAFCTASIIPLDNLLPVQPAYLIKQSRNTPRDLDSDQETPRFFMNSIKSTIIQTIKYYRSIKHELQWAWCFSRYAGIVSNEKSDEGRAMKTDESGVATLRELLRNIVRAVMFFVADLTPQPVSNMMKTATDMWQMTRDMFDAMDKDEMGHCSIDYMTKRFWWWIGI